MEHIHSEEKRKIIDLMKKSKDGDTSGSNMDWLYNEKTNSEDYLLGKKIDKHFERGNRTPPKEDDVFGERIKANIALDMQAKMREDPLYAIKKREEESKKKILNNPVKMKELQQMIAQQKEKKKKMKKKLKHKHSGSNADDDLVQQYLSILTKKHDQHKGHHSKAHRKERRQNSSDSESDDDQHRQSSKTHRKEGKYAHRNDTVKCSTSSSSESESQSKAADRTKSSERRSSHSSSSAYHRQKRYGLIKSYKHSSSRSMSPKMRGKRRASLSPQRTARSTPRSQHYRPHNPSPHKKGHRHSTKHSSFPSKRKLNDEERERRLQEMMDNAKWREGQRRSNVHRYQKEDLREEEQGKKKGSSADFLNPLMSQHATSSTVEDRLRRNKYNIQRTNAALDKDFTKH